MGEGLQLRKGTLAAFGLALGVPLVTLWWGWRQGWLLLLDWAPGPRAAAPLGPVPSAASWFAQHFDTAVGWLPPVLALVVGGAGAAAATLELRADRSLRWPSIAVATAAAIANPFVITRLYAGQVGVLWAYAMLFWLVRSVLRSVERPSWRSDAAVGLLWAACIAATVHAAAIAAVPVAAGLWLHRRRSGTRAALRSGGVALLVATTATLLWALPWWGTTAPVDPRGSDAAAMFLTRGDGAGAWFGALSGSGFWRPLPSGLLLPALWMAALVAIACVVAVGAGRGWGRDARLLLWSAAAVGAVVALAGHGPTAALWAWLIDHVTLVAVHREPGKWSMLPVAAGVLLTALAVDRLRRRSSVASAVVAAVAVALSVWAMSTVTRHVQPSEYPAAWAAAAAAIDDDCRIAMVGDGAYVDPGFTGGRVVANPALGFFGERAVVSSDTGVNGLAAARPSSAAQRWLDSVNGRYLAGGTGIEPDTVTAAAAGVGWVFIARPPDEPTALADLADAGFEQRLMADDGGLWQNPDGCRSEAGEQ